MSVISNRHSILPFVAGSSTALDGQRISKVGFKLTEKMKKEGKKSLPSVFASVPKIDKGEIATRLDDLMIHVVSMLEKAQDDILRSKYESSGGQCKEISDEEISINACLAYMNAESVGARLSVDSIGAWFDSSLADSITVLIAEKLGFDLSTTEQEKTVSNHVKNHRDVLGLLAGKSVVLAPRQVSAIENMLKVAEVDDMHMKLAARLVALSGSKEIEFLL